ncbi:MAG: ABC transporter substrate-binding protein [Ferrovibrio sp.]|uniref:ABC transporter substrate-binding protein n=1 Tax=Ferrovibrio sp. TaxID=1917215 RepID=UPI002604E535|nr:ABC transporter substrate-binding protein [Ferrovibrio sp.]MCW0233780.1 ABC transporter substrate-binding protein [Ferrovibrio sp.]
MPKSLSRRALLAAAAPAAAAAVAAPALLPRLVRAQSDDRPSLRIAVQALPPTLEPLESISNVGLRLTYNVFDTLLRRDFLAEAKGEGGGSSLVPHLATSLRQRDPLTWEAALRPGVRLQDGGELTADDVLSTFSAERMWGPQVQAFEGKVNFGHLAGVDAVDRYTVLLRTRSPDVAMPHRLAAYGGWIHSAKACAAGGLEGMRKQPVGSGPYRHASFARDQRVVLDSHDDYWMGRPPAKQIIFSVVPEASTRLAGLQAGDFDLVTNLLPEQAESLAGHPKLEGVDVPLDFAHILYYDTRRPVLRDVRVRRALNHAVDCDLLGRSLWGPGYRRMAALQVPAFGALYDAGRQGFEHDPARARQLLREAGYGGEEIVIRIAPAYYLQMLQAVQIVQQMWLAVGVNSRIETRENLSLLAQPGADVRPTSIAFRFPDPLGGGLMVHLSRDYFLQKQGFWQPDRFNAISDALATATDRDERRRLWLALLDEYEAEAPALILYPVREYFAKRRNIRWTHYPLYYMDFRGYNLGFA